MPGILRAGVGRATITPPVGIAHAGWGAQTHERAEGVDQDFVVTVLVLADDDASCAIVDLDTGHMTPEDAAAFRELVGAAVDIPSKHVRVSFSHTHAGPILHALNVNEGFELVAPYWETLRSQTVGAARQAAGSLRRARVGATYGSCDIAVNRRLALPGGRVVCSQDPDGFTDPTVTVARIDAEDGSPIAAIVGYACHPITLAFQSRLLSPDYPGVVRRVVEDLTGATCLFLQGAAGDQMPIEALTGDVTVHRRLGTRLGATAAATYLGIDTLARQWSFDRVVESGAPLGLRRAEPGPIDRSGLRVATRMVDMPLRQTIDPAGALTQRDAVREELAHLRSSGAPESTVQDAMFRMKRSEMRLWFTSLYAGLDTVAVELHGVRVGPVALVGFPGEPFARTGATVRERSPIPVTLLSGYTNGWRGYVPTQEEFPRGGYEVEWGSHFAAGAAEVLAEASLELLTTLSSPST